MNNIKKYNILIMISFLISCDKVDFNWNLPKDNPYHGYNGDTTGYYIPNEYAPRLITGDAQDITESTSVVSGEINFLGSSDITEYGHCWSSKPLPSIFDSTTKLGFADSRGIFSSNLKNLNPNTVYYTRAYATNSFGTSYGNQVTFLTKPLLCDYNDCSSLDGFKTYIHSIPRYNSEWRIFNFGIKGKCLGLSGRTNGGFIEFQTNHLMKYKITFWVRTIFSEPTVSPSQIIPKLSINNLNSDLTEINSKETFRGDPHPWKQYESNIILQGTNLIKIEFLYNGAYSYSYYIDEIEFWCQ